MKFSVDRETRGRWGSAIIQFLLLFAFWLVLSGRFQPKYIILGALSSALVTWITRDYFFTVFHQEESSISTLWHMLAQIARFISYLPWIVWQITVANVQVAYYVLHPKMPVEPEFLLLETSLKKGSSQVSLANSITLTPGTITASMRGRKLIVHTLKKPLAGLLEDGSMEQKIGKVFRDDYNPQVKRRWVHTAKEGTDWIQSSR